ncbi:MAG: hypothetical protein JSU64_00720 [candidate division WOR-3 bacterium]|nr:MAG: hypothetical protein JSU64_00720 [candidate division WOR-3 bacterium]UCF05605.1 MAG: hypothetical protein JSV33_00795 [bacterium]
MIYEKRTVRSCGNWAICRLIALLFVLCALAGCSEDCPVCPEDLVETPIVPYISYYDNTHHDLICAKKIGDSWGTKIIEWDDDVGLFTSIALDADNNAHISYFKATSYDLHYAVETEDGWLTEVVDTENDVGRHTSIAIDSQGNPHISYCNWTAVAISYAHKIGGEWNTYILENPSYPPETTPMCTRYYGEPTSLCLDASNTPHICYVGKKGVKVLIYAVKTGEEGGTPTWAFAEVDNDDVGRGCSMALDPSGKPRISYLDINHRVKYAWMDDGGEWHNEFVAGPLANTCQFPTALAIDTDGNPHIAYYTDVNELAYSAKKPGSGWLYEIVDGYYTGAYCSIAIDTEGKPHISYYEGDAQDLRYAVKCGNYWIIDIVDFGGNKGNYTSIAIGSR